MGLFAQIQAFMLTFLVGIITGLIFHYYQSTIHNLRIGRYVLYLMDLILWIIMIIVIASALFLINQGEIRVYVFMALLAGGAVYYKSISPYMQKPVLCAGKATAFTLHTIFVDILAKPFNLAGNWIWTLCQKWKRIPPPDDNDNAGD